LGELFVQEIVKKVINQKNEKGNCVIDVGYGFVGLLLHLQQQEMCERPQESKEA
jgi:hypothetical protein